MRRKSLIWKVLAEITEDEIMYWINIDIPNKTITCHTEETKCFGINAEIRTKEIFRSRSEISRIENTGCWYLSQYSNEAAVKNEIRNLINIDRFVFVRCSKCS